MTEILGVGGSSTAALRFAVQNEQQQVSQQQSQVDQDGQNLSERRIEQVQGGRTDQRRGNPGNESFDFSTDDVQKAQVDISVDERSERKTVVEDQTSEQSKRSEQIADITLTNVAQQSRETVVRMAEQDVGGKQKTLQDGIAQTESMLDSNDFTQTVDEGRELEDTSNLESRATKELGRVLDTFA